MVHVTLSPHSSPSARPLVQLPSFNSFLTNIGKMPMPSDEIAAHRGRAQLTSSPAHYHSPARPGVDQSMHGACPQGLMPPAQICSGPDIRTPDSRHRDARLTNVDPRDLEAAETLMIMRSGGTPRKREVSQNRLPTLPSVERDERPKTPTRVVFSPSITMRTPDRHHADSSRIHSSPYTRPSPSQAQLTPAQFSVRKSAGHLTPSRAANAQPSAMPIRKEPGTDAEMILPVLPRRTLRPLYPLNVNSVPLFYPKVAPNGEPFDMRSTSCFQFGEHGLPLDKVKLGQMRARDVGVVVSTPGMLLTMFWPGYPLPIGLITLNLAPADAYSELLIAKAISTMVEELQTRVHKSGATIHPAFQEYELNKKVTTRNLRLTHLPKLWENTYEPILCLC
ncbi:hypothetical protein BD410DRAFT_501536 [Rickenella mellea]|uniref:Uncharacterized protein n=1 Tax=Rickenella mellea TaxID=50990 RepID=A0A4Y7PU94_9AGAM|nr:hypothetical protein BD410DRAFT_501536 [Rickenella mellea]